MSKINLFNIYVLSTKLQRNLASLRKWIISLEVILFLICVVSIFNQELNIEIHILKIMVWLVVPLLSEGAFLFISSVISKRYSGFKYLPGGSLSDWYEPTYIYNVKIRWLDSVLRQLEDEGVNLDSIELLSPSANKGKYEYEISKKYPKTKVVATDITIPIDHVVTSGNFRYLSEKNNALNARNYLKKIGITNVDLIFDIKGALWHSEKFKNLENILKEYYHILNAGGAVVFDAYDFSNEYIFRLDPKIEGYRENSTFSKIKRKLKRSEWFHNHFDMILTGEGETKVAILRKK
ncbi:hypothetical protein Q9R46_14415 [Paenibacillus sp. RRE4]|uniref:hypothetical protein n=1 Tax=Paenibacillus sp. RRE4 TaxID=2962587 RepID=UPI0028828087|nr:hypothetical protein [Paenibacillus sp. RRE4]MDT0123851.1 hypothetical protein [Paenibacillus sp. RRE4]